MPIKLDTTNRKPEANFHPFKIDDQTEVELQIQPPTFADLTADLESPVGFIHNRIDRNVIGWRGVEDSEGNAVEFSQENLQRLCVEFPSILTMLAVTLNSFYSVGPIEAPDSTGKE